MLRCLGCGDPVSEWAARCPRCHRSIDDAAYVVESVDLSPSLASAGLEAMTSLGGRLPGASAFSRMIRLSRNGVAATLHVWWGGGTRTGVVRVQSRLQLGPPLGDPVNGWAFEGRVRRLTSLHWVPIVIELWPLYDDFFRMTMTPQVRILASKRYFRLGHSVLDRLSADLAETSADLARLDYAKRLPVDPGRDVSPAGREQNLPLGTPSPRCIRRSPREETSGPRRRVATPSGHRRGRQQRT